MVSGIQRFVYPMRDRSADSERSSLSVAMGDVARYVSSQDSRSKDVALYLPSRSNLAGSLLSQILGEKATSRLLRGGTVHYPHGIVLRVEGKRTIKNHPRPEVVLAALADPKMLVILDQISEVEAVFVVPWEWERIRPWATKWQAEVYEEG